VAPIFIRVLTASCVAALIPQCLCNTYRIDAFLLPPGRFVAGVVQLLVVRRTQRHGELVGDFAAKRVWLGEGQVMGLGAVLSAYDTAVADDELQVVGIAQPLRLAKGQRRLVDALLAGGAIARGSEFGRGIRNWLCFGILRPGRLVAGGLRIRQLLRSPSAA
jgi:hypothetical protein